MNAEKKSGRGAALLALLLVIAAGACFAITTLVRTRGFPGSDAALGACLIALALVAALFAPKGGRRRPVHTVAAFLGGLTAVCAAALLLLSLRYIPLRFLRGHWDYLFFAYVPVMSLRRMVPVLSLQGQELVCLLSGLLSVIATLKARPEESDAARPAAAGPAPVQPARAEPAPAERIDAIYRDMERLRDQREALGEAEFRARLLRDVAALRELGAITEAEYAQYAEQLAK